MSTYDVDDTELTQFIMLYAKVTGLECDNELRCEHEGKWEGARLDCTPVRQERKSVKQSIMIGTMPTFVACFK